MICKKCGHDVDKYTVLILKDGGFCPCGEKIFSKRESRFICGAWLEKRY